MQFGCIVENNLSRLAPRHLEDPGTLTCVPTSPCPVFLCISSRHPLMLKARGKRTRACLAPCLCARARPACSPLQG